MASLTLQQRKNLEAAVKAATTAPSASNPLVTAAEQPWEESSNIVQLKSGFGDSGCKVGTASEIVTATAAKVDYTVLLMHMEDAGLSDDLGHTTVLGGDAVRSSAQAKFGTYSVAVDGTGDKVTVNDSADWDLPGDFVIDFWLYPTKAWAPGNAGVGVFSTGSYESTSLTMDYGNGQTLIRYNGSAIIEASGEPTQTTWNHYALVRSGTSLKLFKNGTLAGSATSAASFTSTGIVIGARLPDEANNVSGYFDEFRITNGSSLGWIGGFTPPSAAHTAVPGYVSSDFVSAGTKSFNPATLGVTIDAVARQAPADLGTMDAAFTIDYSFSSAGGDGTTGFTGSPVTPTVFTGLALATFASKSHLFLKLIPVATEVLSSPKLSTPASGVVTTKTGSVTVEVNGSTVYEVQTDGDLITADISADDIMMTGDLTCSGEGNFDGNISVGASGEFQTFRATTSTPDGTQKTIVSVPVAGDSGTAIHAVITGNEASSANKNKYVLEGMFYRNGSGDVTQLGDIVSLDTNEGDTVWNATFSANTGTQTVDVLVSGEAGTTVDWKCFGYYTAG